MRQNERAIQNYSAEIALRAARRLGQIIPQEFPRKGNGSNQHQAKEQTSQPAKLADIGISRAQSHRFQRLASLPDDLERKRRARQANAASETVVPTTFVDDAELVWSEAASGKTQEQVGQILGWSREKVKNFVAMRQINPQAWGIIGTTFEEVVPIQDEEVVPSNGTTVPFTEGLLRAILDLRPPQQIALVQRLIQDQSFTKSKFKTTAEAYRKRNAPRSGPDLAQHDAAQRRAVGMSGVVRRGSELCYAACYAGCYAVGMDDMVRRRACWGQQGGRGQRGQSGNQQFADFGKFQLRA